MKTRFIIVVTSVIIIISLGYILTRSTGKIYEDTTTAKNISSKNNEQDTLIDQSNIYDICIELDTLDLLDDKNIYDFINSIKPFNDNDFVEHTILTNGLAGFIDKLKRNPQASPPLIRNSWDPPPPPVGITFDFPENDFDYLTKQLRAANNKSWDLERLGRKEIFIKYQKLFPSNNKFDWDVFYNNGFYSIKTVGLPLFNKEKNVAIIFIRGKCGFTCGGLTAFKYELINESWIKTASSILWIS